VRALKVPRSIAPTGSTWARAGSFVLPSGQLKDEPATWYGGAHIDPKQVAAMERALVCGLSHDDGDQPGRCAGAD
jgi:putative ABC transport system permease protein